MDLCQSISLVVALPTLAYFSLAFEGGYQSRARGSILRAIVSVGAAAGASALVMAPYYFGRVWLPPEFLLRGARVTAEFLGVVLCVMAFTDTWRHVEAERRERLRWLFVGFGFGLVNFCMFVVFGATGLTAAAAVSAGLVSDALVAAAMLILAYAILRHRVIDVGFAVNRARSWPPSRVYCWCPAESSSGWSITWFGLGIAREVCCWMGPSRSLCTWYFIAPAIGSSAWWSECSSVPGT